MTMTDSGDLRQPLIDWLKERGHTDDEVAHILGRLAQYDQLSTADALMDAIASGEVDLDAIVQEFRDE